MPFNLPESVFKLHQTHTCSRETAWERGYRRTSSPRSRANWHPVSQSSTPTARRQTERGSREWSIPHGRSPAVPSPPRRTATLPATSAEPRTLSKTAHTLGSTSLTCCPLADTAGYILYVFILFIIYLGFLMTLNLTAPREVSWINLWHFLLCLLCLSFSFLAASYSDFLSRDCA